MPDIFLYQFEANPKDVKLKALSNISIAQIGTGSGNGSAVVNLTSLPPNCLLVLATCNNSVSVDDCAVSSSPSLTWTKRVDDGVTDGDNAEIWTAPFPAGGSIAITADWPSTEQAAVCYALLNVESVLAGASGSSNSQALPSVAVTTTKANSIIICITADFNGQDGAARVYRDGATEALYYRPSGAIAAYGYYKQATAIATYTEGLTAPAFQKAVTVVLEIRDALTISGGGGGIDVTPGTGALVLLGLVPTVSVSDNKNILPGIGALVFTGIAPAVNVSDHKNITPGLGQLAFTGIAPTVTVSNNISVIPGLGSLIFTGLIPVVTVSNNISVSPGLGSLILTGLLPTVQTPRNVLPGVGSLVFTGLVPTAIASDHKNVLPGVGVLGLVGIAPVVTASDNKNVLPGAGQLLLSGLSPAVTVSDNKTVSPGVGSLILAGLLPTIQVSNHKVVLPGVGELLFTGFAPTVQISDNKIVAPGFGELLLTGFEPVVEISDHVVIEPGTGELILEGFSPSVQGSGSTMVVTETGELILVGLAPLVTISTQIPTTGGGAGSRKGRRIRNFGAIETHRIERLEKPIDYTKQKQEDEELIKILDAIL